ncbi:MAG: permease [Thermodesulfobacteriota bacterium]|nr:permease [Thermodesulfobacteriota bacterium]
MNFIWQIFKEIFVFYNEVAVYLIFGFLVAAALHILFPESLVRNHLGKDSFGSVFKSSLFGIPLPLCSCGVVPVATSLKNSGASRGATISFIVSTPQVGADSFLITYSLIGWFFGVFRIVSSFLTALAAGIFVNIFGKDQSPVWFPMDVESREASMIEKLKHSPAYIEYSLLGSLANSLVLGIILAGIISALLPDNFFERYLSSDFLSMLLMLLVAVPMYVCASSSTPIAASLIMKGMSPGAALVFLLAGPATNAMGISAVIKVVGRKSTLIYLGLIAGGSVIMGYLLNLITGFYGKTPVIISHQHDMLPGWLKISGSVMLTAMLAWYYTDQKLIPLLKKKDQVMEKDNLLNVSGMNCMHCSSSVTKAVESVKGTSEVSVSLDNGTVSFNLEDSNRLGQVKTAIAMAGFSVE